MAVGGDGLKFDEGVGGRVELVDLQLAVRAVIRNGGKFVADRNASQSKHRLSGSLEHDEGVGGRVELVDLRVGGVRVVIRHGEKVPVAKAKCSSRRHNGQNRLEIEERVRRGVELVNFRVGAAAARGLMRNGEKVSTVESEMLPIGSAVGRDRLEINERVGRSAKLVNFRVDVVADPVVVIRDDDKVSVADRKCLPTGSTDCLDRLEGEGVGGCVELVDLRVGAVGK